MNNESGEVKSPQAKRKQTDQVRHCTTQLNTLKSALEKAILIGDARAKTTDTSSEKSEVRWCIQPVNFPLHLFLSLERSSGTVC